MAFDHGTGMGNQHHFEITADSSIGGSKEESKSGNANGSSIREDDLTKALDAALKPNDHSTSGDKNNSGKNSFHTDVKDNLEHKGKESKGNSDHSENFAPHGLTKKDEGEKKDKHKSDEEFSVKDDKHDKDSSHSASGKNSKNPDDEHKTSSAGKDTDSKDKAGDNAGKNSGFDKDGGNNNSQFQIDPASLGNAQNVDPNKVKQEDNLAGKLGNNGDILDGGGGNNVVIGAGGSDVILGNTAGSFNTVTTGTGNDTVVIGKNSTNRIFDFDPQFDKLGLSDIDPKDLTFGQGTNPNNGGLDQPLDSKNNTVVLDKTTNNILASLTFVKDGLSSDNFVKISPEQLKSLTA